MKQGIIWKGLFGGLYLLSAASAVLAKETPIPLAGEQEPSLGNRYGIHVKLHAKAAMMLHTRKLDWYDNGTEICRPDDLDCARWRIESPVREGGRTIQCGIGYLPRTRSTLEVAVLPEGAAVSLTEVTWDPSRPQVVFIEGEAGEHKDRVRIACVDSRTSRAGEAPPLTRLRWKTVAAELGQESIEFSED